MSKLKPAFYREVQRRTVTAVPQSSWYKKQSEGTAPRPVRLGPKAVAWRVEDIEAWCKDPVGWAAKNGEIA